MTKTSTGFSRRRVLSTVGAIGLSASLAGCSSADSGGHGATDVRLRNVADVALTVSVVITRENADESEVDQTFELAAHEAVRAVNDSKLPTGGDGYSVAVSIEGGPSQTFEWSDPDVRLAPLHILVDDDPQVDRIEFLLKAQ